MNSVSVEQAGERLADMLRETAQSHVPVVIRDDRYPGVLLSAADWRSIHETLFLVSIPGMRESIREGLQTPLDDCVEDVW